MVPISDKQNSDKAASRSFNADKMAGMEIEEPKTEKTESTNSACAPVAAATLNSPLRSLSRIVRRSSGNAKRIHGEDAKNYNPFDHQGKTLS